MKPEQTIYFLQSDNLTVSSGTVVETDGRTYAIASTSTGELYSLGAEQCSTDRKLVYQVAIENVRMSLGDLKDTLFSLEMAMEDCNV